MARIAGPPGELLLYLFGRRRWHKSTSRVPPRRAKPSIAPDSAC